MLCRRLIPTLALLSILAAPVSGAAEPPAGPPPDERLATALHDLADHVATLWSTLTEGTSPSGGPDGTPGNDDGGQGGHDPNGFGDPPAVISRSSRCDRNAG